MSTDSGVPQPEPSLLERAITACHAAFEQEAEELTAHFESGLVATLEEVIRSHGEALAGLRALGDSRAEDGPVEGEGARRAKRTKLRDRVSKKLVEQGDSEPEQSAESGDDGEVPPPEPETVDALLEYRRVAMSKLFEGLLSGYQEGPTRALEKSFEETVREGLARCEALDADVEDVWADDALAPRAADPWIRRLGKPLARVVSSARKSGEARSVPLRSTAVRHYLDVTVPSQEQARIAMMTAWAEWSRQLEVAVISWVQVVLDLLVELEDPGRRLDVDPLETVRSAAEELQERLEALAAETPEAHGLAAARASLEPENARLAADLAVAGSFLYRPELPEERRIQTPEAERVAARLSALDEGFAGRLRMYISVLGLLTGLLGVRERLLARFRMSCLPGTGRLIELAGELDALAAEIERAPDAAGIVDGIRPRVEAALKEADSLALPLSEIEPILAPRAESMVEAMFSILRGTPESVVINPADARARPGLKKAERRVVPLQEFARQSFDALRMERIRSAAANLSHVGESLDLQMDSLPQALSYAYEQAQEELDSEAEGAAGRARSLVAVAVRNIAESIRAALGDVEVAMGEVEARLCSESRAGAMVMLDRIQAGLMQAQLLRARSGLTALRAWLVEHWGPRVARATRVARIVWERMVRLASKGLRRGSQIVAGHAAGAGASTRDLRMLANPKAVTDRLPLVYQRLFTFDPVSDAALLAGRDAELREAMDRWERWKHEDAVPLIVRGRQGTGISSFLTVLCAQIAKLDESVLRIELPERIWDEKTLARLLSRRLGLPACSGLADIATAVFATHDTPGVVSIDNLEHLYLRVPGGTDLTERLLTLMSETEPRIFWIGGISTSAWQLVATAEPNAVSQVEVLDLSPLTPEELREAITVRHRRSGLPVRFEEPTEGRAILRRRLRRARTAEARRELLVADFFDQLQRNSGGNLRLALFLSLQASDFETGDGLLMHPPMRPDLSLLETLTLTQNFTLKAFLEHRTLTLTEHDRIFRLPRHESYQIFESLVNRHLIRVLPRSRADDGERSEVEEELRYAIRPLLVGAVIEHLTGRNIVH